MSTACPFSTTYMHQEYTGTWALIILAHRLLYKHTILYIFQLSVVTISACCYCTHTHARAHTTNTAKHTMHSTHTTDRRLHTPKRTHLALKVYSVPPPPHVSLDGLSRKDWSGKASLDCFELSHIIPSKVAKHVASSNAKRGQAM